jgi:hypothetical protein
VHGQRTPYQFLLVVCIIPDPIVVISISQQDKLHT